MVMPSRQALLPEVVGFGRLMNTIRCKPRA